MNDSVYVREDSEYLEVYIRKKGQVQDRNPMEDKISSEGPYVEKKKQQRCFFSSDIKEELPKSPGGRWWAAHCGTCAHKGGVTTGCGCCRENARILKAFKILAIQAPLILRFLPNSKKLH